MSASALIRGIAAALVGIGSAAAAPSACLSPGETQEIVGQRQVIAPTAAMNSARQAVPDGEILRASLCRSKSETVYVILMLRRDGRLVHVTIDAPSGKVATTR